MSSVFERLRQIVADRFQRQVRYVELNPYSNSPESSIVDIVLRNGRAKKIVSGRDLIIPLHVGDRLSRAAVIADGSTLDENQMDMIVDTVSLILDGHSELADRADRARQVEAHLQSTLEGAPNVIYLDTVRTRNKEMHEQITVGRRQGPYLTQILLEGKSGIPFQEIAFDIHQKSGRSSFISWNDLDKNVITDKSHLIDLGAITIFIPDLSALSSSHQAVLDDYVLNSLDESTPRIMAAIQSPLVELVEQGKIKRTLAFYFSKVHLQIPPHVERKEDILELVGLSKPGALSSQP